MQTYRKHEFLACFLWTLSDVNSYTIIYVLNKDKRKKNYYFFLKVNSNTGINSVLRLDPNHPELPWSPGLRAPNLLLGSTETMMEVCIFYTLTLLILVHVQID